MCKFCTKEQKTGECNDSFIGTKIRFGILGVLIHDVYISDGCYLRSSMFTPGSSDCVGGRKKINYCPICGRKLEETKE